LSEAFTPAETPDDIEIYSSSSRRLAAAFTGRAGSSAASNQHHRRPFVFKLDRRASDRSSAVERGLHDRSRPQRLRRAHVDLRPAQRDISVQKRVL